ncbi:MAG: DNA-3-methyladenine glycosylase [Saprospiraceae bacterium]|nr:DNA-3-methyladenine glycosylase [Saprospiraceae bacterium]
MTNLVLHTDFYQRPDVVQISRELLGKFLVTDMEGGLTAGKIVEVEAYRAPDDKACHAYQNKRTPRTEVMFMPGGYSYVYLCYGIHHLFNVVTGTEGSASAVLIRAVEPVDGIPLMMKRRGFQVEKPQLTAGPGVMTQALGITTKANAHCLFSGNARIWIEDRGKNIKESEILASPRVGVAYATECAHWPWRFRIKGNPWCSKAETKYKF